MDGNSLLLVRGLNISAFPQSPHAFTFFSECFFGKVCSKSFIVIGPNALIVLQHLKISVNVNV